MNTLLKADCLTYQESPDMSDVMLIFGSSGNVGEKGAAGQMGKIPIGTQPTTGESAPFAGPCGA